MADGASSKVDVQGGQVSGGEQGILAQSGGCLEATDLEIVAVGLAGAEAQGEGCCLATTRCGVLKFGDR